jgi:hypothetical protein
MIAVDRQHGVCFFVPVEVLARGQEKDKEWAVLAPQELGDCSGDI